MEVQESEQTDENLFSTCLFGTKCKQHRNNRFTSLESLVSTGSYCNVFLRWVSERFLINGNMSI